MFDKETLYPSDLALNTYTDKLMKVKLGHIKYENGLETDTGVSCCRREWSKFTGEKLVKVPPTRLEQYFLSANGQDEATPCPAIAAPFFSKEL